jgi:transcriptional regulator with XRE-family HTH domain
MTLREVASTSVVSIGHLSDIENGRKMASPEMLEALARGLSIDTTGLMKAIYLYLEEQN